MFGGVNLLSSSARFAGPRASGTAMDGGGATGTGDYGMVLLSHLWLRGMGGCLGAGPRGGPSLLSYPGSLGGRPASRLSIPVLSIRCMYTLPTTTVCASGILPLLLPLSALRATTALFPSPSAFAVFILFVG